MEENEVQLDPNIQKEIDRILGKEIREMTKQEKAFLRASKAYIGKKSRARFSEVFEGEDEPEEVVEPETTDENVHPADAKEGEDEKTLETVDDGEDE